MISDRDQLAGMVQKPLKAHKNRLGSKLTEYVAYNTYSCGHTYRSVTLHKSKNTKSNELCPKCTLKNLLGD